MIYEGGQVAFVRDGKHYQGLFIGNALLDAVEGNPRAEQEARKARNLEVGGFVVTLGGLGVVASGIAVEANSHPVDEHAGVVTALLLSGLACELVGLGMTLSSQPHFYDAMNMYNDDIDRALAPPVLVPVAPRPFPAPLLEPAPVAPAPAPAAPSSPEPSSAPPPPPPSTPMKPPSAAFPAQ